MADIQLIGKDIATGQMVFLEAADAAVPTTDNDKNLGSSTNRFQKIYVVRIGDAGDARLQIGAIRISGPDVSGTNSWDQSYGTGDSTGLTGNAGDATLAAGNCTNAGGNGNAGNARVAGGVASGSGTDGQVQIYTNGLKRWIFENDGTLYPFPAGTYGLGGPSNEIGHVYIGSDRKLHFGNGQEASMEFDDDGTDKMLVLGTWDFSGATVEGLAPPIETFVTLHNFANASGTMNTSYEDVALAGDFLQWIKIASSSASGRLDAVFAGRLSADHTTISSIKTWVKKGAGADPQFDIQIYCEGQAGSNQYTGTYSTQGTVPGAGSATQVSITDADITNQPATNKRYFIFVRAYLDAGEDMYLTPPFVKHE